MRVFRSRFELSRQEMNDVVMNAFLTGILSGSGIFTSIIGAATMSANDLIIGVFLLVVGLFLMLLSSSGISYMRKVWTNESELEKLGVKR